MRNLIWFRRDLRLSDNRALRAAAENADALIAVAFLTPAQWQQHNESPAKIAFWKQCLRKLAIEAGGRGIDFRVVTVKTFADIPAELLRQAETSRCNSVYFNAEYEYNEQRRDHECVATLKKAGIGCQVFHDRCLIEPGRILTGSGGFYTVFTPFKRSWFGLTHPDNLKPDMSEFPVIGAAQKPDLSALDSDNSEGWRKDLWPPGEAAAQAQFEKFAADNLHNYHLMRDLPAQDATSRLSPWLAAGVLSIRQCFARLMQDCKTRWPDAESGAGVWLNELIWRDFYSHVLVGFPRVSCSKPFKVNTEKIAWNYDEKQLKAWQAGMTGYPIVDAAMRQLKQTGWMHNRLRMVTAMFLSKHLLIDWRHGEKYFMENLMDGDLAANNGGWQWSASTGTDAVPYFRIFNPFSQSSRFDADGKFIRQYCPELAKVSNAALHDAKKLVTELVKHRVEYPEPVVDHQQARARALAAFKKLSG